MEQSSAKITNLQNLVGKLNSHEYENLQNILVEGVDWFAIDTSTILPRPKVREFIISIEDKAIRLDVLEFLIKFGNDFFRDNELNRIKKCYDRGAISPNLMTKIEHDADDAVAAFKKELNLQIDLINSAGLFSAEKYRLLEKQVSDLSTQVKTLQEDNKKLSDKIHVYEHPTEHHFIIPEEFLEEEFWYIMNYLKDKKVVYPREAPDSYGIRRIVCYQWLGEKRKGLFGYFADRLSFELDIYKNKRIQWNLFRMAFINFKDVEKQAKDTVSAYKSWSAPQAPLPQEHDLIDKAIKYAEVEMAKPVDKLRR